jgi:hypothetical protein
MDQGVIAKKGNRERRHEDKRGREKIISEGQDRQSGKNLTGTRSMANTAEFVCARFYVSAFVSDSCVFVILRFCFCFPIAVSLSFYVSAFVFR